MDKHRYGALILIICLLAGCGAYTDGATPKTTINPFLEPNATDSGWMLEGYVENEDPASVTVHNVTVVAYSGGGEKVCETYLGTLNGTNHRPDVSIECTGFPAIVTATAREPLCEKVYINIGVWEGTDQQKRSQYDDPELWGRYERDCDGTLPPERFVET